MNKQDIKAACINKQKKVIQNIKGLMNEHIVIS
jgi:hypothetical protein